LNATCAVANRHDIAVSKHEIRVEQRTQSRHGQGSDVVFKLATTTLVEEENLGTVRVHASAVLEKPVDGERRDGPLACSTSTVSGVRGLHAGPPVRFNILHDSHGCHKIAKNIVVLPTDRPLLPQDQIQSKLSPPYVVEGRMKEVQISDGIVPLGEFKAQAAKVLKRLADSDEPVVITQNGRPAGVLLSPREFDRLQERQRFLESIAAGLADAEAGRVVGTTELRERLQAWRTERTRR